MLPRSSDSVISAAAPLAPSNNYSQHPQLIVLMQCGIKRYAPDNDQAIHCAISLIFLTSDIFASYESVVGTSIARAIMLTPLNPSCAWVINCIIDWVGDQPILCQRRLKTRKVVSDTRLHCDPDYQSQLSSAHSRHIAYVFNPSVTSC